MMMFAAITDWYSDNAWVFWLIIGVIIAAAIAYLLWYYLTSRSGRSSSASGNGTGESTAADQPEPTVAPAAPRPLVITHPEEPMDPIATLANTNTLAVLARWLTDWDVPVQYRDYWMTAIDIQVYETYPPALTSMGFKQDTPAATWESGGKRHLAIKPAWLNPGVIAHEQAHNSYALLSPSEKAAFSAVYTPLKTADALIKLLYSKNTYGLTNDIEGHAEVYRYIGQRMPEQLKVFYPRLF